MFIYTPLLLLLSALSATAMGDPEIYSAQITPAPTTVPSLALREATTTYRDPPDIVRVKPTPFPSFCCSYNTTKVSDSLVKASYVLNLNGFGNTDSSPAHSSKSTDLECVVGLKNVIDEAFMSEGGYKKSLWCYPSYGGTNDTYVVIDMTAHPEDQGAALLDVVRKWAPTWATVPGSKSAPWVDPRNLIPDDATCQMGGSCSSQQLPLGYCKSNCS